MRWLVGLLSVVAMTHAQENIRFFEVRDEFTDADTSRVVVYADEQPRFGRSNILVWRCQGSDDLQLFVEIENFLTSSGFVPVIFRFDNASAESQQWNASTTGVGAFSNYERQYEFTSSAVASTRVIVGVTDYRGVRYSYTFRLSGLQHLLERLSCFTLEAPPQPVQPVEGLPVPITLPIPEAYTRVRDAVPGLEFTEDLNVIYFDGLTIRFVGFGTGTLLVFDGSNRELYERIRAAFDGYVGRPGP